MEKIPPKEKEDIQAAKDMVNSTQKAQYGNHRRCFTDREIYNNPFSAAHSSAGTHGLTQELVKGKLIVKDDLPKHLK